MLVLLLRCRCCCSSLSANSISPELNQKILYPTIQQYLIYPIIIQSSSMAIIFVLWLFMTALSTMAITHFSMPQTEYNALLSLYDETNGPLWTFAKSYLINGYPWNFSASPYEDNNYQLNPCNAIVPWQGVKCSTTCENITCHVLSLSLPSIRMVGKLPRNLTSLEFLVNFDVSDNLLSGTVPQWLQSLSNLRSLQLGNNLFTGSLPEIAYSSSSASVWPQLVDVGVQGNLLIGSIPSSWGQLQSLKTLLLFRNKLTGSLPESLSLLTSLESLSLWSNRLRGNLPSSWASLHNMSLFDVSANDLTGSLPQWMSEWRNLTSLILAVNRFEGSLPEDVFYNWSSLHILELSANRFSSSIPSSICHLPQLGYLDLSVNEFTGNLPDCTGYWQNLLVLRASFNSFSGSLPNWLNTCVDLRSILLRGNHFTGSIPNSFSTLPYLQLFDVRFNELTGSIPESMLKTWKSLRSIALSGNYFHGTIPDVFSSMVMLEGISLNRNLLTGTLPQSLNMLTNLTFFEVGENWFSRTLPDLRDIVALEVIGLHGNLLSGNLNGYLPYSIVLKDLDISDNIFSGSLNGLLSPQQYQIEIINVGSNRLTGSIPMFGGNRTTAVYLNSNSFTGTLPFYTFRTSPYMRVFIATENCFTGSLSDDICSSIALYELVIAGLHSASDCHDRTRIFNSYIINNGVGGTIPPCLFNLPILGIFHASGNSFTGSIPSVGYQGRTNMTSIHLSTNFLTGELPDAFWSHDFTDIDMSFNRFKGSIPASYAPDLRIASNTNSSLVLNINRLSGSIPSSLEYFPSINILDGNMFSCRLDRSDLPKHDPKHDSYMCGSSWTDFTIYAVMGLLALALLGSAGWMKCRVFVRKCYEWYALLDTTMSLRDLLLSFHILFIRMCRMVVIFVVLCFVYFGLSVEYSTYTRAYIWTVSSTYLQGVTPAIVLLNLFLIVIAATMMFDFSRPVSPILIPELHDCLYRKWSMTVREFFIIMVFSIVSVSIVAIVNYGYVRAIYEQYTSQEMVLISVAMSMFKLVWSVVVVMGPLRWKIEETFVMRFSEQSLMWISVINNVIVPYGVEIIASPDCFHYLFSSSPSITTVFLDIVCESSLLCTDKDGEICKTIIACPVLPEVLVSKLYTSVVVSPPFVYSFECSSAVLSGFAYIFAIRYAVNIFLTPMLFFILKWLIVKNPNRFSILTSMVSPLWRPIVFFDGDGGVDKEICNKINEQITSQLAKNGDIEAQRIRQIIVVRAVLDTAILLAFGLLFPPLGIIVAFSMMKDLVNMRSSIGRLVDLQVNSNSVIVRENIKSFLDKFQKEMIGWNDMVMAQITSILVVIAYILASCLFDTLGSEVGALRALWIFVVMASAPFWISNSIYWAGRIMRKVGILDGDGKVNIKKGWILGVVTDSAITENESIEMKIRPSQCNTADNISQSESKTIENPLRNVTSAYPHL